MKYTKEELIESKRQIDFTIHKLRQTIKDLKIQDTDEHLKTRITLINRQIKAFEIANDYLEKAIEELIN